MASARLDRSVRVRCNRGGEERGLPDGELSSGGARPAEETAAEVTAASVAGSALSGAVDIVSFAIASAKRLASYKESGIKEL